MPEVMYDDLVAVFLEKIQLKLLVNSELKATYPSALVHTLKDAVHFPCLNRADEDTFIID